MDSQIDRQGYQNEGDAAPRRADKRRVRRLLLKTGAYVVPAVVATALTAENALAFTLPGGTPAIPGVPGTGVPGN